MKKLGILLYLLLITAPTWAINLTQVNGKVLVRDEKYYLTQPYLVSGNFDRNMLSEVLKARELKINPVNISYFGTLLIDDMNRKSIENNQKVAGRAGASKRSAGGASSIFSTAVQKVNETPNIDIPLDLSKMKSCVGDNIEVSLSGSVEKDGDELVVNVYNFSCYDTDANTII
jgi:hypothetical protein